jgi:hypothetical protein
MPRAPSPATASSIASSIATSSSACPDDPELLRAWPSRATRRQQDGDPRQFYPRGSLVLVDELAAVRRDSLNMGLGWTATTTGEAIVEMCERWDVKPRGVADDACFAKSGYSSGSIADEFNRAGVYFTPAKKADRITGWQTVRRLMADAGKPDRPGRYVTRGCEYFWAKVPYLARPEAETLRYRCLRHRMAAAISLLWASQS